MSLPIHFFWFMFDFLFRLLFGEINQKESYNFVNTLMFEFFLDRHASNRRFSSWIGWLSSTSYLFSNKSVDLWIVEFLWLNFRERNLKFSLKLKSDKVSRLIIQTWTHSLYVYAIIYLLCAYKSKLFENIINKTTKKKATISNIVKEFQ